MKGGYLVIDMHGMDVETGGTVSGIYNNIESNYHKPIVIHNITKNGVKQVDEYATKVTMAEPIVITTGSTVYTIDSDDGVNCSPFDFGGAVTTAVKMVKIPATVTVSDGANSVEIGDKNDINSTFNIWAYYFDETDDIYIPPVPNRQTVTSFYCLNNMTDTPIPFDINYDETGRPWGTKSSKYKISVDIGANSEMYFFGVGHTFANPQVLIPSMADLVSINANGVATDISVGGNVIVVKKLSATNYSVGVCVASEGQKTMLVNSAELTIPKTVTDKWVVYVPTQAIINDGYITSWDQYDLVEMYMTEYIDPSTGDGISNCSMNIILPRIGRGAVADNSYKTVITGAYTDGADIVPTGANYAISFTTGEYPKTSTVLRINTNNNNEITSLCDTYKNISIDSGMISKPLYFYGATDFQLTDTTRTTTHKITENGFTKFRVYKKRGV